MRLPWGCRTNSLKTSSRANVPGQLNTLRVKRKSIGERERKKWPIERRKRAATPTNVSSGRRTSGLESRDGRRAPYAATVDYSSSSARESSSQQQYHSHQHHHQQYHHPQQQQHHHHHYQCHRRGRSASPEMLRSFSYEEQSAQQQHSPGSSPEPDDNSSTSGDEGKLSEGFPLGEEGLYCTPSSLYFFEFSLLGWFVCRWGVFLEEFHFSD